MRAAIYTRISADTEGEGLGVARQEQDCRKLCEAKGWSLIAVYVDNDFSAFSGKPRPEYERLLEDVKAGALDVIVAWHPDRLHRSPKELERFIELLEIANVTVATVTAGDRDFATPDGRFMARIEGSIARRESEHKSQRIRRKHQELAEKGAFVSGKRPYGYDWALKPDGKREGIKLGPAEAKMVREAARRVLAGESLYAIVNDWNARGVPTVTGAQWSTKALLQILTSGRVAGWRDYQGATTETKGQWKAILDQDTWDQVRAILLDPNRKRKRAARSYLLGQGVLRCGECGGKLVATPQRDAEGNLVPQYACRKYGLGGCGKVSVRARPVEAIVSDAVIRRLCDPAFVARLGGAGRQDDDALQREEIAEMEASLEEAARDFYVDKMVTRAEFVAVRSALVPRLDAAKAKLATSTRRRPAEILSGIKDLEAEWEGLSSDRQRALIDLCIESVTIKSAKGRAVAGHFDESRVQEPVWRA